MRITVVNPHELGESEVERWRSFQQAMPSLAGPFLSPEFTVAVGRVRAQARVVVVSEGPDIVGFFPFGRRGFGREVSIAADLNQSEDIVHAPDLVWNPKESSRKSVLVTK